MTHRLRPLFALFTRALREDVRARFPPILRAVLLLVLLCLLGVVQAFAGFIQANGQFLLGELASINFLGISLLGLTMFGSAITEEKEDETLGLLRMTQLNPLSILLGKGTARLTGGLLLLLVQVPFAILCVTLGGVKLGQIYEVYAILGAYLFFLCNLGLLSSVRFRTTPIAVTWTLSAGLAIFLLAPIVWFSNFAFGSGGNPLGRVLGFFTAANPVIHLVAAVNGSSPFPFQPDCLVFLLVSGLAFFLTGWLIFNRYCSGELSTTPAPARSTRHRQRQRARVRTPRAWPRALVWKDYCFSTGGLRGIWIRSTVYIGLIGIILSSRLRAFNSDPLSTLASACTLVGGWGFGIEFALACASLFGRERKQQTLGTLWVLPIKTSRLIWQKVGGYLLGLLPGALLWITSIVLAYYTMLEWIRRYSNQGYGASTVYAQIDDFYLQLICSLSQFLFFGLLIVYLSLRMRRGALVMGVLAYLLWSFFYSVILTAFLFRFSSMGYYRNSQVGIFSTITAVFGLLCVILAFLIPRRLATCAAED